MAKKKPSAKKANVKKAAKKAVSKKTPKKSTPAKTTKKTVTKKAVKKTAAKKPAVKKTAAKKTTVTKKSPAAKAAKPVASHLVKESAPPKKLDLSHFVTPLDDRIIVQLSGTEKRTPGGLYIPDTVADTSGNLEGYVVAVGRGHMSKKGHVRPMDVQVGDRVVFSEYAGSKIKIQNEDLIILREGDVMGVVSK